MIKLDDVDHYYKLAQFENSVVINTEHFHEAVEWCNENIGKETYEDHEYGKIAPNANYPWGKRWLPRHLNPHRYRFMFYHEKDFVWFNMVWGNADER